APVILHVREEQFLITVIRIGSHIAFAKHRAEIEEKVSYAGVFVVAALSLDEGLRRNQFAKVSAELERMISMEHRNVIDDLVVILDCRLWRIWIGPNTAAAEDVIQIYVWKLVQARERKGRNSKVLDVATV